MKPLFFTIICFFQLSFSQKDIKHVVYFETDKYSITDTENDRLLLFLNKIEPVDIEKITIYGFCDDRGSYSYNLKLSKNRADAIKAIFYNNEFDESLITNIDGKGELLLNIIKENNIQKVRGRNRKVEIIVTPVYPPKKRTFNSDKLEATLKGDLKAGDKILLENLLFVRGYNFLVPESKIVLNKIADILVKRRDIHFTIEGHVCCTNGQRDAINGKTKKRNLSHARAKYVYEYLVNKGVNRNRMKYVGMRRKYPLGGPQEFDRRVELLVTKTKN